MFEIDEMIKKVEKALREAGISAEVYQYETLPLVAADIHWGDWKHEHLRADWVIREIGGKLLSVFTTEENGTDCYSATRVYSFL